MSDESVDLLETLLGLGDMIDNVLEDENGQFDKRQEPTRALVLLERALENREMIALVLERALVAVLKDGEGVTIDGSQMFEGGGTIKVFRHEDHLHIETIDPPEPAPTKLADQTYPQAVAALQTQIYSEQYYVERYQDALRKNVLTSKGVEEATYGSEELTEMLNDFWFSLPDSPAIRTGPFFLLCDLCEGDPSVQ